MSFYLASRYSRRLELCRYRDELDELGYSVTSRWLNGDHQIDDAGIPIGENGTALIENGDLSKAAFFLRRAFSIEDVVDVHRANVLIHFTEAPRSSSSRGGRHVEMGIAIGAGKPVWIVGHRENLFCWLPNVKFFESWAECKAHIERTAFCPTEEAKVVLTAEDAAGIIASMDAARHFGEGMTDATYERILEILISAFPGVFQYRDGAISPCVIQKSE